MISGRVVDPAQAEAILEGGTANLVGMTRALFAGHGWPAKVENGRVAPILVAAWDERENRLFKGLPVARAVNSALGRPSRKGLRRRLAKGLRAVAALKGKIARLFAARDALPPALWGSLVVTVMLPASPHND